MYQAIIDAPFGRVGIRTRAQAAAAAQQPAEVLDEVIYLLPGTPVQAPLTPLALRVAQQIEYYFEHPHASFDVPYAEVGTPFQQRVRQAISAIPCGTVHTYGQMARTLGSAARAVGQACGSNAFPLLVPCHRVVAASGLGGFAHHGEDGYYHDVKRWLLRHEGVTL